MVFSSLERGDAVDARHHHVDDGGVERHRARELDALGAGRGETHVVALADEQRLEDLAHDLFIVDDENGAVPCHELTCFRRALSARFGTRRGPIALSSNGGSRRRCAIGERKRRRKTVPLPSVLSQVMTPPCSRTMP